MITLYVSPNNISARKAQTYLRELGVSFVTKSTTKVTFPDVVDLAKRAGGITNLVSMKSTDYPGFLELLENEDTTLFQLYAYVVDHPRILKAPIAFDDGRFEVGFTENFRAFIPRTHRKQEMSEILEVLRKQPIPEEEEVPT